MFSRISDSFRALRIGCVASGLNPGWAVPSTFTSWSIHSPSPSTEAKPMPEIISTTVYRIDELEGGAKIEARNWYRNVAASDDWHEFVFEDFETIADILGVQLKTETVRL